MADTIQRTGSDIASYCTFFFSFLEKTKCSLTLSCLPKAQELNECHPSFSFSFALPFSVCSTTPFAPCGKEKTCIRACLWSCLLHHIIFLSSLKLPAHLFVYTTSFQKYEILSFSCQTFLRLTKLIKNVSNIYNST